MPDYKAMDKLRKHLGAKRKSYALEYMESTESDRVKAKELSKKLIEKEAIEKPQAFIYRYLLAKRPGLANTIHHSVEKYNTSVTAQFSAALKIPIKKYFSIGFGLSTNKTYYAREFDSIVFDVGDIRKSFIENPEEFESAVNLVFEAAHKAKSKKSDQHWTSPGVHSFIGSSHWDMAFKKITDDFDLVSDAYGISTVNGSVFKQLLGQSALDEMQQSLSDKQKQSISKAKTLEEKLEIAGLNPIQIKEELQKRIVKELSSKQKNIFLKQRNARIKELEYSLMSPEERQLFNEKSEVKNLKNELKLENISNEYRGLIQERLKQIELQQKFRDHNQFMNQWASNAHGVTSVIGLIDPKLSGQIKQASNALSMTYDALETMSQEGKMSLANIGNMASGIGMAITLVQMTQSQGPSAQEIMIGMLKSVLENQKKILEKLDDLEEQVSDVQSDIKYLATTLGNEFDEIESNLDSIRFQIEKITTKFSDARQFNRNLALDSKLVDLETSQDDIRRDVASYVDFETISQNEIVDFSAKVWTQMGKIASYAVNEYTSSSHIFSEKRSFTKVTGESIESELQPLSAEWRVSLMPEIADWVNQKNSRKGVPRLRKIRKSKFEGVSHPRIFMEFLLPRYVEASNWYKGVKSNKAEIRKLKDQLAKIEEASMEARSALESAISLYRYYAAEVLTLVVQCIARSEINKTIKQIKKQKTDSLETIKKRLEANFIEKSFLNEHSEDRIQYQGRLIQIGNELGLWTIGKKSKTVGAKFYNMNPSEFRLVRHKKVQSESGANFLKSTARAEALMPGISKKLTQSSSTFLKFRRMSFEKAKFIPDAKEPWKIYPLDKKKKVDKSRGFLTAGSVRRGKRYTPPHERQVEISDEVVTTLSTAIRLFIEKEFDDFLDISWTAYMQENATRQRKFENLARSQYALESCIKVGFGNSFGLEYLLGILNVPVYSSNGLHHPQSTTRLLSLISQLEASSNLKLPTNYVAISDDNPLGFGDMGKARSMLDAINIGGKKMM